jgi:hypothetical protein
MAQVGVDCQCGRREPLLGEEAGSGEPGKKIKEPPMPNQTMVRYGFPLETTRLFIAICINTRKRFEKL